MAGQLSSAFLSEVFDLVIKDRTFQFVLIREEETVSIDVHSMDEIAAKEVSAAGYIRPSFTASLSGVQQGLGQWGTNQGQLMAPLNPPMEGAPPIIWRQVVLIRDGSTLPGNVSGFIVALFDNGVAQSISPGDEPYQFSSAFELIKV